MFTAVLFSVFSMAFLGGLHCAGMCGGIVGAFSNIQDSTTSPVYPLHPHLSSKNSRWIKHWPHHIGRITSYSILGALVASWGPWIMRESLWIARIVFIASNCLLIGMGLYMSMQAFGRHLAGIYILETHTVALFKRIQPHISRLIAKCLPADTCSKRFALGVLWGFLPCGMIYSALGLAALSGTPIKGAAIMMTLWAGTLPNMLWIEGAWKTPRFLRHHKWPKLIAGLLITLAGIIGLLNVSLGTTPSNLLGFCINLGKQF